MINLLLASIPPTPTPLPAPPSAPLVLPDSNLWDSTPIVINLWNLFSNYTYAVQIVVILAVVITAGFIILRVVRSIDDADDIRRSITVNVRQIFSPTRRRRRR